MSETKHASLVDGWRTSNMDDGSCQIITGPERNRTVVARSVPEQYAQYIVTACNAFPALVDALEAAIKEMESIAGTYNPDTEEWDTPSDHPFYRAINQARAALALAKAGA